MTRRLCYAAFLCVLVVCSVAFKRTALGQSPTCDSFNANADAVVTALALQPDGKVVVGGSFTNLGGQVRFRIARLNADGSLDAGFNPGADGYPLAITVQRDGKILVGGEFTVVGGQSRQGLARLNADGTLDTSFQADVDGSVNAIILLPDGRLLVGGAFNMLSGQPRACIARLSTDGTLDLGFNPSANGTVYSLAVQGDGRILAGGDFTLLAGEARSHIGRLNLDGAIDPDFSPVANDIVYALLVQPDGKILVGGEFGALGGQPRLNLGRLNPTGSVDTFNPRPNALVFSLALQADGRLIFSGGFTALGNQSIPRNRIARVNIDGTLDTAYNPGANHWIYSLMLQQDGKAIAGGHFTALAFFPRNRIGRLNAAGAATQSLTFDGATVTWLRGGSSPEVWRTTFESSLDGESWSSLGEGQRIVGGWQLTNAALVAGTTLRARGYVLGGYFNGSGGIVETNLIVMPPSPPIILLHDGAFGVRSNLFGFNVIGPLNQSIVVDASTNLLHWIPLHTNFPTGPIFYFSDPTWLLHSHRIYRARNQQQ